jgi:hypothetical protein
MDDVNDKDNDEDDDDHSEWHHSEQARHCTGGGEACRRPFGRQALTMIWQACGGVTQQVEEKIVMLPVSSSVLEQDVKKNCQTWR